MPEYNKIIDEAKDKSLELLQQLATDKGFIASSIDTDNYRRVFSRDGVIAGISALYFNVPELHEALKQTLLTLRRHQDKSGRIPSNVSLDEATVSYGTTVGRIDATIWYVIGCCKYYQHTNDKEFLLKMQPSIQKCLFYLDCLELNGRGLIYVPPGGDWADEYINEGYVLFDQMLYIFALEYYAEVFEDTTVLADVENIKQIIKINFFPSDDGLSSEFVYQDKLFRKILEKYQGPVPLASFSAFGANYRYDLFAIALVCNSDILNFEEKHKIEKELENCYGADFSIYPAFYPVIEENDIDWLKLQNNYIFRLKNKPYEYHNGGLWSMVYGFYLNAKNEIKEQELIDFAILLQRDDYIFPEFYHGQTHEAMGVTNLGFSASGYLLAYQKFISNHRIFKIG